MEICGEFCINLEKLILRWEDALKFRWKAVFSV